MNKHRSIRLPQHVFANLDREVRPYPEDLRIEGGVVQFAHRKTVRNDRKPPRMPIWKDMSSVEKFRVLEAAHRATLLIGPDYPKSESLLMKPLLSQPSYVRPSCDR